MSETSRQRTVAKLTNSKENLKEEVAALVSTNNKLKARNADLEKRNADLEKRNVELEAMVEEGEK